MKRVPPWIRFLLAALLLGGAVWMFRPELPEPRHGTVEVAVRHPEAVKLTLWVNRGTKVPKNAKERLRQDVLPAPKNHIRVVAFPLRTSMFEGLGLEFHSTSGAPLDDASKPPEVAWIGLRDAQGKLLAESVTPGPEWFLKERIRLAKAPLTPPPLPALPRGLTSTFGWGLLGLGLGSCAWGLASFWRSSLTLPKFVAASIVSMLLCGGAYFAAICGQMGAPYPSERWVHNALVEKRSAAAGASSPKMLMCGGSSGLFSLDGSLLSRETGRPVINMALHAALPLRYHLKNCWQFLKEGDAVMLHLEFGYWQTSAAPLGAWYVDQYMVWARLDSPPPIDLNGWQVVTHTPPDRVAAGWAVQALPDVFPRQDAVKVHTPATRQESIYPGFHVDLNAHGDLVFETLPTTYVPPQPVYYLPKRPFQEYDGQLHMVAGFTSRARALGVRVFLAYPPTIRSSKMDFTSPPARDWVDALRAWCASQGVVVLGSPEDFSQPLELFRDSIYHLTAEGREIHTRLLLNHLRAAGWPAPPSPVTPSR